jgi:biopolymer transport protein ExbD
MRTRSIRFRGKNRAGKKQADGDLDITSLLDIITILLVFLIQSYNSNDVVINVSKDITLPISDSITLNTPGVVVQVSPTAIWVDDQEVINLEGTTLNSLSQNSDKIIPLYDSLVSKREIVQALEKASPQAQKFSGMINLTVDKSLKYSYLKKVMATCAEAGYKQFKLIVRGQEQ